VPSHLLQRHAAEGEDFLPNILAADESWFHHFDPGNHKKPAWDSITLHFQRIRPKPYILVLEMSRGAKGLIYGSERKLSMQFVMFRRSRNCYVHFVARTR
jgi:hypothetical protein